MQRLLLVTLAVLIGCNSTGAVRGGFVPAGSRADGERAAERGASPIKHLVIIVQENRSFDNLFSGFPGADAPAFGFDSRNRKVTLSPVTFESQVNLTHDYEPARTAWNRGKMNGFEAVALQSNLSPTYNYAYLDRKEAAPYWTMARTYTLADRMFPTEFGPSFTGHLALIAGTTSLTPALAEVDNPPATTAEWGCGDSPGTTTFVLNPQYKISPGPFPCFSQFKTLADSLDAAHVSWRYYAPPDKTGNHGGILWSSFSAIKNVYYGPDWANVVSPPTTVLTDAFYGKLPAVSWVIPDWKWSDHPSSGSDRGPSWVAAVVNAIGEGPDWSSTAIVIVWDDWGGWYDDAPPPQKDFRGLGIRVGCIIVSPYARPQYVSHTPYEFGSILHFAEDTFGLPPIGAAIRGYTDRRAPSLADSFDFKQQPLAFKPIAAKYPAAYFFNYPPSMRAPDTDL
ncbi:MAG: hypothetical protein JO199_12695 [Candidatus Eremiobacteraeota bacterium]|nr:hypothetical protein [Candidatus Eremiobacteraeota bacterium]